MRGMMGGGGVTGGGSNLRLKTALDTMKLSPQNSFGESHSQRRKALRALNALGSLSVYPVFEHEKSKG